MLKYGWLELKQSECEIKYFTSFKEENEKTFLNSVFHWRISEILNKLQEISIFYF